MNFDLLVEEGIGMSLIKHERQRQIEEEGWAPQHDKKHGPAILRAAAKCYEEAKSAGWPWEANYWKPKSRVQNLIRAGALYVAANEADIAIHKQKNPHDTVVQVLARKIEEELRGTYTVIKRYDETIPF